MNPKCLVHAGFSFSGRGVAQSCASIVAHFSPVVSTEVVLARVRTPLDGSVRIREALPLISRKLPWRLVSERAARAVDTEMQRALRQHDPASTVVYVWPGAPLWLVREAREQGFPVVREMINSACATSGPILDDAYTRLGLPVSHAVTAEVIEGETEELVEYDYLFASNPQVEASLARLGIAPERILPTTFGWDPDRYANSVPAARVDAGVRVLFVGSIGVRKGIPELLDAWRDADIPGELVLAGVVEPVIVDLVERHVSEGRVRLAGYVADIGAMYLSADIFVFPTLEEGGPQVTYEAAGCGLPIITTPMGAARLVQDGRSGIVVDPGDRVQLAEALRALGTNEAMRAQFAANAKADAVRFDYRRVGRERGRQLAQIARREAPTTAEDDTGR